MSEPRAVAIVTGAARGIGAAVAVRLAADGYDLVALDLDEKSCEETVSRVVAAGASGMAVGADVADEDSVSGAMAAVVDKLGPPTVLVNNAGILRDHTLRNMSVAEWDDVMAVHLRGSFLMSRAVQQYMVERGFGRIVNMSSVSALGNRGQANYSAAKAGLQGFTRTLAIELGKFGVTANAVAPGFIDTEMTRSTAQRMGVDFEELSRTLVESIAVGRPGAPEDVAAAVSFFCREDSGFVSGQTLYVAGGPQG